MRADARRNRDAIVAVAGTVVAEQGAAASLEEIARRAGVGSATLHRHFPDRHALLEAVFADRVAVLCGTAADMLAAPEPGAALVTWLRAVVAHATANRGLGAVLVAHGELGSRCHAEITAAGQALLARARRAGAVHPAAVIEDLLALANAISLAGQDDPDRADRLVTLLVDGVTGQAGVTEQAGVTRPADDPPGARRRTRPAAP
jgi:AcrR family transcriptional regulator